MLKTYKDWNKPLNEYLQIGDQVDDELRNHFIDVMPPATYRSHLIQMGEPYSHVDGKATYATLAKEDGKWIYKGHCFRGESDIAKPKSDVN